MSKIKIFLITLVALSIGKVIATNIHIESVRLSAFMALLFGAGVWAVIALLTDTTEKNEVVVKDNEAEKQPIEDDSALYLDAMNELKKERNEAVWAKCFAEADGDKSKAEAAYIKVRVNQLKK